MADSHVGEYLDELPEGVLDALEGCDPCSTPATRASPRCRSTWRPRPVAAVRGDHDRLGGLELPETAVVVAGACGSPSPTAAATAWSTRP